MDPRGHFLYVADPNNDVLHVLSINPNTGATTPVTGSPFSFPSIGKIAQIAASPASPFVFVYDQANAQLDGLSVDGVSGMPTLLASGPVAVGPVNMNVYPAMRFDPSGQHLYVGEGSGFEGFAISDTGALTAVPGSPFSLPNGDDFQVSLDPSNQFLYSGYYDFNLETGALASYRIAPSGALTLVSTRTAPSTDEDGGMGFLGGASPLEVAPAFAYTADGTGNDLTLFAVNAASGGLSALSSSPLKGTTTPIAAATDLFGQFVFTLDQGGLEVYTEDPFAGSLTLASGAPYTAGTNPSALAVDPLDRFVFVANQGSNNVSVFQLNSGTGALTTVPGSPFPADAMPSAFAVDPAGQVLLVANAGSAKVSAFHVLLTGALRADAPPFAAGTSPVAVAIDASGHYAYVVNRGSNDISIFSIMPDTDVGGGPGLLVHRNTGPARRHLASPRSGDRSGRPFPLRGGRPGGHTRNRLCLHHRPRKREPDIDCRLAFCGRASASHGVRGPIRRVPLRDQLGFRQRLGLCHRLDHRSALSDSRPHLSHGRGQPGVDGDLAADSLRPLRPSDPDRGPADQAGALLGKCVRGPKPCPPDGGMPARFASFPYMLPAPILYVRESGSVYPKP